MNEQEAKEIIDRLTSVNLNEVENSQNFQRALGLIRNFQYSKTHFILELLQNADDCKSKEISFTLSDDKVEVRNFGDIFNKGSVTALSSIGNSTKGPEHIGFFGIGFKSVFSICSNPEIYSGEFSFEYNDQYLFVPYWIEKKLPLIDKGALFVLKLKNKETDYLNIKNQMDRFSNNLLLYLKNTSQIDMNGVLHIRESDSDNLAIITTSGQKSYWKRYSKIIDVPLEIRKYLEGERSTGVSGQREKNKEEIILTFEVLQNGKIKIDQKGKIFAFLPTEITSGFKFNIQADFSVNFARTALLNPNADWNQWILKHVCLTIPLVIEDYKKSGKLEAEFYKLLPLKEQAVEEYLEVVKEKIDEYIKKSKSILTEEEKWVKPEDAIIPDTGLKNLIKKRDLKKLFGKEISFISEKIDGDGLKYINEVVPKLTIDHLLRLLDDRDWLKRTKNVKWFASLFIFFADYLSNKTWSENSTFKEKLRGKNIIITESQNIVSPVGDKKKLYRLPEKGDDLSKSKFVDQCEIVNKNLIDLLQKGTKTESEKEKSEKALELLEELVPELSPQKVIQDFIKPIFTGNNWDKIPDDTLTSYIEFVKNYPDYISMSYIKLKTSTKDERIYKSPKENHLYIPKEFGNDNNLEIIFDGSDEIDFVSTEYIKTYLNSYREDAKKHIKSWNIFLKKLRVKECPPIVLKREMAVEKSDFEGRLKENYPNDTICETTYTNKYKEYRIDDYAFPDYLTTIIESWINEKVFIFNWNEIPGNDDDKIINFLEKSQRANWVKSSRIEKINEGREITISDGKSFFSLSLNNEKTEAFLKNDQGLIQEFIVKTESEALNLYENPCRKLKILMQIIHDHWSEYSKYTESKYLYHNYGASGWNHARLGLSSFGKFLKESNWVPTISRKHLKPSAIFLNSKDISSVEYNPELVDCQLENEKFIKFIELQTEPSIEGSIKYLDGLVNSKEKDIESFRKIYVYIYNFLKTPNSETKFNIIKNLDEIPFIYTPEFEKKYRTISEVTWQSSPSLLNWKVGIEKYYYGLEEFFVDFLNVRKNAEFEDFIQFLRYLWEKEMLDNNEKDSLTRIYSKLNERLDESNDFSNSEEWQKLKIDFKFWCQNNRWVSVNKEIFYNDNSKLYTIFSKDYSLNFIDVTPKKDLSALINNFNIKSLSKSVEEICEPIGESKDITTQNRDIITRLIFSIAGFIKQQSKQKYTEFLNEGLFTKILNITIKNVQDLSLMIKLEGSRIVKMDKTKSVAYSLRENCLYLKVPFESSKDNVALEISTIFINIEGLADFIALIIDKTNEQIKTVLENRKIDKVIELLELEPPFEKPKQPELPESSPEASKQPELPESPPEASEQPELLESPPEAFEQLELLESPPKPLEQPELFKSPPEASEQLELLEFPPKPLEQPELTPTIPIQKIKEDKVRNSKLAKRVKETYGYHCQICLAREKPEFLSYQKSYSGRIDNRKTMMDGHHVKSLSEHEGHDHFGNYLSLCHFHHQLIHQIGLKLDDLEVSLDSIENKSIIWHNGEEVNWFLITISNIFKENGLPIKLVITPPHLKHIKKYIEFLKK